MTSPIGGIVPVGIGAVGSTAATAASTAVPTIQPGEGGDGFAATLAAVFDQLQGAQSTSNQMATQAATGDLRDVHDYMIASAESGLATEMVVTIKNKAVEAFNEIMRMPV